MTHPWVMDNNCVKYHPDQIWLWGVMVRTRIFGICALWPWPLRYDLGSRWRHNLGSWTIMVWNIIQIQLGSEELWPGHGFPVCVHCDLDPWGMTFGQGHDTPLGHGQQLCEILSRSDKWLRNYGPDTMWTDGQTDRQGDSYIPPNFVCGGYNDPCEVWCEMKGSFTWQVTVSVQALEYHLALPRGILHVVNKIFVPTIKFPEWQHSCVSLFE